MIRSWTDGIGDDVDVARLFVDPRRVVRGLRFGPDGRRIGVPATPGRVADRWIGGGIGGGHDSDDGGVSVAAAGAVDGLATGADSVGETRGDSDAPASPASRIGASGRVATATAAEISRTTITTAAIVRAGV